MTQIILVRHGQTPWNKDKIFRGSKDIPLNDQGREEARLAGEWLKGEKIDLAYTSPLSRSRDTAQAIAQHHGVEVKDLPGLSDLCYGDWEGLPLTEVKVKYADLYHQWESAPHMVRFPGGETLAELTRPGFICGARGSSPASGGKPFSCLPTGLLIRCSLPPSSGWTTPISGVSVKTPRLSTALPGPELPGRLYPSTIFATCEAWNEVLM